MLPYNNQNEISIEKTQLAETLFQTEKNVMFHELFNEKIKTVYQEAFSNALR